MGVRATGRSRLASAIDESPTACMTDIRLVNPRGSTRLGASGGTANESGLAVVIVGDAMADTAPPRALQRSATSTHGTRDADIHAESALILCALGSAFSLVTALAVILKCSNLLIQCHDDNYRLAADRPPLVAEAIVAREVS